MRANSFIIDVICCGTILGSAAWLALEHQARLKADREHATLARQVEQMSQLIARNRELADSAAKMNSTRQVPDAQSLELLRLRGQVGVLREQCKELDNVRSENHRSHAMLETGRAPKSVATAD